MKQHTLSPKPGSRKKAISIGRGDGSGHGSYSGRGMKGQSSRSGGTVKPGFEGGQTPLIRRLPKLKGFKNPNRLPFQVINVVKLNVFENGATVDLVSLFDKGFISKKNLPVKLLGDGEVTKKLTVKVDAVSNSAKGKIEAAGGSVLIPAKKNAKIIAHA